MSRRVLITGVTGFIGKWLADLCLKNGDNVVGIGNWRGVEPIKGIEYKEFFLEDCGVIDYLHREHFDVVFHLAAQSSIPVSHANPSSTYLANVMASHNLLRSIGHSDYVQLASSSNVYGPVGKEFQPIEETQPLWPTNPYGISKATMEMIGLQASLRNDFPVIVSRLFTCTGPRQPKSAAVSSFARQVVRISKGFQPPVLRCGNIDNRRTFIDVRDVVSIFYLLSKKDWYGGFHPFNVSGRESVTLRDIIVKLGKMSGVKFEVVSESPREGDITLETGNISKLETKLGTLPLRSLDDTLWDVYTYWYGQPKEMLE